MLTNPHNLAVFQTYLARTIAVLAGLCAVAVFLYSVFLLLAVSHTAARSSAQKQIAAIGARLGTLEMQYLAATKDLTPERANVLGFVSPTTQTTVFAGAAVRALSLKQ